MPPDKQGPLIRGEKLVVRFGDHTVLDGVTVELRRGEILVVLGGSGCGKSTLLRHLVGLRQPEEGRVSLFDRDLYGIDSDERAALLTRIGMLFQSGALLSSLSLEDNVALPLVEHRKLAPEVAAIMARMKLAQVGLENAAGLLPAEVSGGMKKRAGLARALALDPEVLLFDEPSAGLDPVTARGLDDLIVSLKERLGVGILVVTHELASIEAIADRVVMLERGKVIAQGQLAEVKKSSEATVQAFFARQNRRQEGSQSVAELLSLGNAPPLSTSAPKNR